MPWIGKGKRVAKALSRAYSAYNKWEDEVRWATVVMRRAEADAKAMAKYAEDYADWKKQADAAKAAKKAEEAKAAAAKKTGDSGGSSPENGGSGGAVSCNTRNSFTPDTQVLMADGTTKAIKDIKPGDKVIATDPEGHEVLDLPNSSWNTQQNDRWIRGVISSRQKVYVASPERGNLITPSGRETVFARELRQLREAGYSRNGDHILPPR